MFSKTTLATIIATTLFSTPSIAEIDAEQSIIVTATRTAQTVDETLASVTVINRQQIEQSQANSLDELLQGIASITFVNNGGLGKSTSLFMRGTNSDHVLLLIDGIRTGSATLGGPSLQFISLDQIERIEVVRGAKSSLYGSDAIGGIIQIFTRKGSEGQQLSAEVGLGSYSTRKLSASLSGMENGFHYNATVSRLTSEGFDAREATTAWPSVDEPDNDGYKNNAISIQLGKEFSSGTSISAYLQQSSGLTEFDGSKQNETEFKQASRGIKATLLPNDYWETSLHLTSSIDENDNLLNDTYVNKFNTERHVANWQNELIIGDNSLVTIGLEHQKEKIETEEKYAEDQRSNRAIFTQYQGEFDTVQLGLGLRRDNSSSYGTHHSGQINLGLSISNKTQLIGNYATAFKAPSFNDLYWPEDDWSKGNLAIKPETSKEIEVGIKTNQAWGKLDLRLYRNKVSDLINWAEDEVSKKWIPSNIDTALIKGLEIQYLTTVSSVNISTNINYLKAIDSKSNKWLPHRSKHYGTLTLDKQFGNSKLGLTTSSYSFRYEDASNTKKLNGYSLVGIHAEHALSPQLTIKGKVGNLFNRQYQTADTYNAAGRELYISLAYKN